MAEHRKGGEQKSPAFLSTRYRPAFLHDMRQAMSLKDADRQESLSRMITHATEESFDAYSILELVHAGLSAVNANGYGNAGERILTGVETYLGTGDIITKYAFPFTRKEVRPGYFEDTTDADQVERGRYLDSQLQSMIDRYQQKTRRNPEDFKMGPETLEFLYRLRADMMLMTENGDNSLITFTSGRVRAAAIDINLDRLHGRGADRLASTYGIGDPAAKRTIALLGLGQPVSQSGEQALAEAGDRRRRIILQSLQLTSPEQALQMPEQLLESAFAGHEQMGEFDFTQTKFGGVSLEEIFRPMVQRDRTILVMRYIAGMPRGDVFWRQVAQRIFFMSQIAVANTSFRHPDWTEALYMTQLDMADMLLTPGIAAGAGFEVDQDDNFQQEAGRMIANMDMDTFWYYIHSLYNSANNTSFMYLQIHQKVTVNEFVQRFNLYHVAVDAFARAHFPDDREEQIVLIDEAFHWCVEQYYDRLIESWQPLLDSPKLQQFSETINDLAAHPYEETHTRHFLEILKKRMESSFWERLDVVAMAELDEIQGDIISTFTGSRMMRFWPTKDDLHKVKFTGRKLPEMLGLESIDFIAPSVEEASGKKIQFLIEMSDPRTSIRGSIPVDFLEGADAMELTVDLSDNPKLLTLLRFIVITQFHDLVLGKKTLKLKTPGKPAEDIEGSGKAPPRAGTSGGTSDTEGQVQLPRKYHSVLDEPYYIESEDLYTGIEKAVRRRRDESVARTIESHPMALRGAVFYQQAVREYYSHLTLADRGSLQAWEVQRETLKAQVQRAREDMYHISQEKREQIPLLPASFRDAIHTIIDPLSRELVYLDTWVAQFTVNPGETEPASLKAIRNLHYRNGPQSRLLDDIMVRLWGNV